MNCPKCKSKDIQFIADTQSKNRSAGKWIGWLLLAFFTCGIGLIFWFIMALTNKKTLTKTRAVCRNCGYQWTLNDNGRKR